MDEQTDGQTDDKTNDLYTLGINSYDIDLIKKYSEGNYILNFMYQCSFDVDGSEQLNNLILNACGSKKPKLLDYYINILPLKATFPDFYNLKKYVQFDCSNLKSKLQYNDFLIKAIKSNNLINANYLYKNTPIDVNKIFYKIIESGNIIFVKRFYELYLKNNDNEKENKENNHQKIIYQSINIKNTNNNTELFNWFNSIKFEQKI